MMRLACSDKHALSRRIWTIVQIPTLLYHWCDPFVRGRVVIHRAQQVGRPVLKVDTIGNFAKPIKMKATEAEWLGWLSGQVLCSVVSGKAGDRLV